MSTFLASENFICPDKKYFVQADGRGNSLYNLDAKVMLKLQFSQKPSKPTLSDCATHVL